MEADGNLLGKSLERELAVAGLRAGVLGDGVNPGAEAVEQAVALFVGEGTRLDHVEHRLDSRGGHVRVLAARARGAARAQLDLRERQREALVDLQLVGRSAPLTRRIAMNTSRAANESSSVRWLTALETSTPIRTPSGDSAPITMPSRTRTLP